jgi:hypothetical protein
MTSRSRTAARRALAIAALAAVVTAIALPGPSAGAAASGSISGRVLDEHANPLEGICVNVTGGGSEVTDPAGLYTLPGLDSGDYTVEYVDCRPEPAYLDRWYFKATDPAGAQPITVVDGFDSPLPDVTLDRGVAVSGTVTDAGGAPVADVWVGVNPIGPGPSTGTQTAADGTYTTKLLPPGTYTVQFDASDPMYVQQYWKDQPSYGAADPLVLAADDGPVHGDVDAHLAVGATIEGTVTGAGGVPLEGVCVEANVPAGSGWNGVGNTPTGADGTYSLGSLPAGDLRVRFVPCGGGPYVEQWYRDQPDFNSSTPIALTAGVVTPGVDAQLYVGSRVSGTVTDRSGVPIPNVNVNVNPDGPGSSAWGQTDADGEYSTNALPPGRYRVQFQGTAGFAGQFWNDQPSWNNANLLTIPAGGDPVTDIDAALDVGASISGHVTGPEGQDVAGVCVNANIEAGQGLDWLGNATTASDGTYTISGLPPGVVKVQFQDCGSVGPYLEQWWDGQPDPSTATAVTLAPGNVRTGIDAQLADAAQITGTVTDGSGDPLPGICVQATTSTFLGGLAGTDSQGHYTIDVARPDDYRVQFVDCNESPTYAGRWWGGQLDPATAQVVPVAIGEVVSGIDTMLAPGAVGSIAGNVTTARGTGMPTACVIAYLPNRFALFGEVHADGTYEIPDVPSGTFALGFVGCDGGEPAPTITDPDVAGVTYPAVWWDDVPLDITGTGNGGPDPIAQHAHLVTVAPGNHLAGFDTCFGCDDITVDSVTPGADRVTVSFSDPDRSAHLVAGANLSASALGTGVTAVYAVTCASAGGTAQTATGTGTELTVTGLTAGGSYTCQVTATVAGRVVANSSVFAAVIPAGAEPSGGSSAQESGSGFAFTGAGAVVPTVGTGAVLLLLGFALIGVARRTSRRAPVV